MSFIAVQSFTVSAFKPALADATIKGTLMSTRLWITFLLLSCLALGLAACNGPAQAPLQEVELIQRTKPPFEPRNFTATAEYFQTETAVAQATQAQQTAQAEATLQALATVTAAARNSAIMAYTFYDPFDQNDLEWRDEVEENRFWQGSIAFQDGAYTWQVSAANEIFLAWSFFKPVEDLVNFDMALMARRVAGIPSEACYGLLFRTSPEGFNAGSYILTVCDEGYFKLLYYDAEQGWSQILDWTRSEAIQTGEWNLLEVSARGEEFTVTINHQPILTFSDERLASGMVAILIDIYGQEPSLIEFDFFALQPR
jgi:hypothetical protein